METYKRKTSKFVVKDYNDEQRTVKGYAAVFNNLDSDNDIIMKGSFNKSISDWGPMGDDRIKLIAQHDMRRPVARITTLKEDDNGLLIEAKFGTHTDGEDYYRMTKEGIINEFSVGFVPIQKKANVNGGNDISNLKLYEVSMVTIAANDEAVVTDVKSNQEVLKLVKQVEDKELRHNIEREVLILDAKAQEIAIQAESDLAVKEDSSEQDIEVKAATLSEELANLILNKK